MQLTIDLKTICRKAGFREGPHFDHKWGYEIWLVNNKRYCGKLLVLENTTPSSLHYHKKKTETFIVLSGRAKIVRVSKTGLTTAGMMMPGDSVTIPKRLTHRFQAVEGDAVILEVSTHHEDSDTYRVEEQG